MTKLGSGCYSDVYAISKRYVLKIVKTTDTGYAAFIELCKAYPNNPYLPKVIYHGTWGKKEVYVIERLENETSDGYDASMRLKRQLADAIRKANEPNPFMGYCDQHMKDLATALKEAGMTNDLHNGNIMFRGKQAVVTDPYCN